MTHARRAPPPGRQHGAVGQCGVAADGVAAARPQGAAGRGRPSRCGGQGIQQARPVAGGLQGHASTEVLTVPLCIASQGGRGGASGSRGSPSGGRGGRGGGSRRFSEAPKDGIVANDQIPCVPAAACAAMALPVPQSSPSTSWSDRRGLLHSAAGVAGARRYACWAWKRRCWA